MLHNINHMMNWVDINLDGSSVDQNVVFVRCGGTFCFTFRERCCGVVFLTPRTPRFPRTQRTHRTFRTPRTSRTFGTPCAALRGDSLRRVRPTRTVSRMRRMRKVLTRPNAPEERGAGAAAANECQKAASALGGRRRHQAAQCSTGGCHERRARR